VSEFNDLMKMLDVSGIDSAKIAAEEALADTVLEVNPQVMNHLILTLLLKNFMKDHQLETNCIGNQFKI